MSLSFQLLNSSLSPTFSPFNSASSREITQTSLSSRLIIRPSFTTIFPFCTSKSYFICRLPRRETPNWSELWSTSSSSILWKLTGFTTVLAVVILKSETPSTSDIFTISSYVSVSKELSVHTIHSPLGNCS